MKIGDILTCLEAIAPPMYQEGYDNARLLTGDKQWKCSGVLCALDAIETIVDEAISKKCNLIVAHHPIIFGGLKSLTGDTYVQRTIIKAIQHKIAIYAIHTNLDNVLANGVNQRIAQQLELENISILAPSQYLYQLRTIVDNQDIEVIRSGLSKICADNPDSSKSFATLGVRAENNHSVAALNLEMTIQKHHIGPVTTYLSEHGKTFQVYQTQIKDARLGAGLVGTLKKPMPVEEFYAFLKEKMEISGFKHTEPVGKHIEKVALCGGAGIFLLPKARSSADVYITSDIKYHEFFDADGQINLIDVGHYESEKYTIQLLYKLISDKFSKFAVYCTEVVTNPVRYYS